MEKEKFLEFFTEEEKKWAVKIYDSINSVAEYGIPMWSEEFYTPNIWYKVKSVSRKFGVSCEVDGFFENCERKMILLKDDDYDFPIDKPYKILRVRNKSKFKRLEHKHYLGTVMSLGIIREKIGDMIVDENECIFPVAEEIAKFIEMSLEKINGCAVEVRELDSEEMITASKSIKLQESVVLTTSLRLDCVVSSLTNLSRSKGEKLITSKKVLLNYSEVNKKNREVNIGETLTIRGFGKYIIKEIIGETKKDRLRVRVQKFGS